jgi:transposase-like protein
VVFVFGLATFRYAPSDEVGRRLAAAQLVSSKIATSIEVASAFEITAVTLWRWGQDFATGGVAALVRERTGPRVRTSSLPR